MSLPLQTGPVPRPPRWPGVKPKVHFATALICLAIGIGVFVLGATTRSPRHAGLGRERIYVGSIMAAMGLALVGISSRAKSRQRRARAALDAWAKRSGLERSQPDEARGHWRGVPLSIRVAYGGRRTMGDARAWLVEVGEASRRGWVIVYDKLEDEPAIVGRLGALCDAAVASSRA